MEAVPDHIEPTPMPNANVAAATTISFLSMETPLRRAIAQCSKR
jgi:hypothetical protein